MTEAREQGERIVGSADQASMQLLSVARDKETT